MLGRRRGGQSPPQRAHLGATRLRGVYILARCYYIAMGVAGIAGGRARVARFGSRPPVSMTRRPAVRLSPAICPTQRNPGPPLKHPHRCVSSDSVFLISVHMAHRAGVEIPACIQGERNAHFYVIYLSSMSYFDSVGIVSLSGRSSKSRRYPRVASPPQGISPRRFTASIWLSHR